ncbi:MAG: ankyrin repeat domain-containing protein [Thermoproteota archaeon]
MTLKDITPEVLEERGKLHKACKDGDIDAVKRLLGRSQERKKINRRNREGVTPLHCACWNGYLKIAELFISYGADVNVGNKQDETPLHCASLNGHLDIAEFLISHGADVNARDRRNETSLHKACWNDHLRIVKLLVSNGADVNAVDDSGRTPLHNACWSDYPKIAGFLISCGTDVNARDREGKTPLVAELLVSHGANVNAVDKDEDTPLHKACQWNHLDVVKHLILCEADMNVENRKGKRPFDLLSAGGYRELENWIIRVRLREVLTASDDTTPKILEEIPLRRL